LLNFGTTFTPQRFGLSSVAPHTTLPHSSPVSGSRPPTFSIGSQMNTENFEGNHEGWRTLWLAIAGVMAITLIWNVVMFSLNGISY
jgi:hypothetical protein